MNTLYTYGYLGSTPADLDAQAAQLGALIVDIRYSPRSRRPDWDSQALMRRFGPRYRWLQEFGNVHYADGLPMQLYAPDRAIATLRPLLAAQPVILLCACAQVEGCHRRLAADLLAAATGAPVVHLSAGAHLGGVGEAQEANGHRTIKALTLTQPWATLIALGVKRIETRSWLTHHRGWLAIHAAKGLAGMTEADLSEQCHAPYFYDALAASPYGAGMILHTRLPRGAVVAVAWLRGCGVLERDGQIPLYPERAFGNYAGGRYLWRLERIQALPEPIPARGAQGLWDWPVPVEVEEVLRAYAR